MKESDRW